MPIKKVKTGDIFKIDFDNEIRYFQYFYSDPHYLGGDLIWVFNLKQDTADIGDILASGYSFCFYTTIGTGLKLKKWDLIGNMNIPDEMKSYPSIRWRDIQTGIWYELQYDKKKPLGTSLTGEQLKIPIVSFQFPVGALEFIINGKDFYLEKTYEFESKYFEKNKRFNLT